MKCSKTSILDIPAFCVCAESSKKDTGVCELKRKTMGIWCSRYCVELFFLGMCPVMSLESIKNTNMWGSLLATFGYMALYEISLWGIARWRNIYGIHSGECLVKWGVYFLPVSVCGWDNNALPTVRGRHKDSHLFGWWKLCTINYLTI